MAEAMMLSSKKVAEMYPENDTSYAAKAARKALKKGLKVAKIVDEEFSRYSKDIRFLYNRSEEMLKLAYSPREKVKMEYVIDHSHLKDNELIVAFSTH